MCSQSLGITVWTLQPWTEFISRESRCLQCHTFWAGILIVIIISGLLAGIVLVASLLILNLTVIVGTLNGLIFYVNIVAANQYKFFPTNSFVYRCFCPGSIWSWE